MKLRIDALDVVTGWTVNSPSTVALNEFQEYIANLNTDSLLVRFDKDDSTRTLTKSYAPIDVSDYEYLVFSMWSETKGKQIYGRNIASEFDYKIRVNDTIEYYIPVKTSFTDININIEDISTIDRIEITALHSDTDHIILSELLVEYEDMPIDLLEELRTQVEYYLNRNIGTGILLGTITTTAGDTTISTSGYNYLDRYSVFLITNGMNTERHQVAEVNDQTEIATLGDIEDGLTILNNYTDANLYLIFPVYINPDEHTVRLPGISLWGIAPESILRTGKLDRFIEAYKVGGNVIERVEGHVWNYILLVNCEARASGLIAIMTKAIRDFGANEAIWVNGRKHEIDFATNPIESDTTQGIDIIPQVQYQFSVEVIENIAPAENLVITDTINVSSNIGGV